MPAPEQRITRGDPDCLHSLEALRERLAETISWCSRRTQLGLGGGGLRSIDLAPPPALDWLETVRIVADHRSLRLGRSWRRTLEPLGGGRLAVFFPGQPRSGGEARLASSGFFDLRDVPPWDTWVGFFEEPDQAYLISWVPAGYVAAVGEAMARRPRSLAWLDEVDVAVGMLLAEKPAEKPGAP